MEKTIKNPIDFTKEKNSNCRKLQYKSFFCKNESPYDSVKWKTIDIKITDTTGNTIFEKDQVEVPEPWSTQAATIVAQKYLRANETSVKQLVERVVSTIENFAKTKKISNTKSLFNDLRWLLINQYGSFNSPVWFNVGAESEPQGSACFILSVEDTINSIAQMQVHESLIFKSGSGCGANLSTLRSTKETVKGGGFASGPVSFLKGYDKWAGLIKSGGRTRRSARMSILNDNHPDILEFCKIKLVEEQKVIKLIKAGFSSNPNDPESAYNLVDFQNTNISVRLTNNFMCLVEKLITTGKDNDWPLYTITEPKRVISTIKVSQLWNTLCESAHKCGDPGIQFHDTINQFNTCSHYDEIKASNPCGEYNFINNSACNLASLNITKFASEKGLDFTSLARAVSIFIFAQDLLIDISSYPTKTIEDNSRNFRPLGLGYTNIGTYFMTHGIPYGSEKARSLAAEVTSFITALAYTTSAIMAKAFEPYHNYSKDSMIPVIEKHANANNIYSVKNYWKHCLDLGNKYGFRNAQTTVIAPTGTISFMMDCSTTGIEPEMSLIKTKKLAGGGHLIMENPNVADSLRYLEYSEEDIRIIVSCIKENGSLDRIKPEHRDVFKCSMENPISIDDHLYMVAAVQPFLSGCASKTINMQQDATIEDVSKAYLKAWKLGVKAITIYRNGSKAYQPVVTQDKKKMTTEPMQTRKKLPDPRKSLTKKFSIDAAEGYFTVGMYEDGSAGELFISSNKEGTFISGLLDSMSIVFSLALQYGCPIETIIDKFEGMTFEPSGYSDRGYSKSLIDYLAGWLKDVFTKQRTHLKEETNYCICGGKLIKTGPNCHTCQNCGQGSGCGA